MSQRETPSFLADGSSLVICIFPNLRNVNILGENMQTVHVSLLMLPRAPTLLRLNHWHLAVSLSVHSGCAHVSTRPRFRLGTDQSPALFRVVMR